jgi:hypothetical protein
MIYVEIQAVTVYNFIVALLTVLGRFLLQKLIVAMLVR